MSAGASPTAIRDKWADRPAIDIELVHEVKSPPYVEQTWRMVEVWTQQSIYGVDPDMMCIEVLDQASRKPQPGHGLLGARLVGGQYREEGAMHLSHPFPRPGTEAVFEQTIGGVASFSTTSTVTRVVLRLRHLTIASGSKVPTWDELAGATSRRHSQLPEE